MFITDRLDLSSERKYTDEGFLIVPAKISRTGTQDYHAFEMGLKDREPSEIITVFRPEEEVFSDESLISFANKPLTDNHPPVLVDSNNAKEFTVGHSGPDVVKDGIFATTMLFVTDAKAIKSIESGKVELSNGYTSDLDWTPGVTPDGIKYDAVQRNIKGNHIAIVDKGRCGSACRVSDHSPTNIKEPIMGLINIDGVSYDASEQVVQAVSKLQQRVVDAEEETKKKEDELEEEKKAKDEMEENAKKSEDSLQAKLDDASSKQPTPQMLDALVDNRIATRDAAIAFDPEFKWENKDCEVIRKEVVSTHCKDIDIENVSADYIRARFDALVSEPKDNNKINDALVKQNNKKIKDESSATDSRQDFIDRNRNAWKGGNK